MITPSLLEEVLMRPNLSEELSNDKSAHSITSKPDEFYLHPPNRIIQNVTTKITQ